METKVNPKVVLRRAHDINPKDYKSDFEKMEVVNMAHDEIYLQKRGEFASYIKFMNDNKILISSAACKDFGITGSLNIHFINDGPDWYFYCNTDPDGFHLESQAGRNFVIITNSALVRMFRKRSKISVPGRYFLKLTTNKYNDHTLIKVELNKPLENSHGLTSLQTSKTNGV